MAAQPWGVAFDIGEVPLDELVALWDEGTLNELWEGRLIQETLTFPLQAYTANQIGHLLNLYLTQQGIAANVGQHMLFNLTQPGQPRTVLAPDVAIALSAELRI